MRHRNLFYLFVVICILVLFAGCSDFFGGNFTTDIQFKINLNDLQLDSRSASPANEVAKLSVELISQDKSVLLKQEQNIIDNTTDYFTFKNIKVGTIIKINASISQEDKELFFGETEWLDVKPSKNLISLELKKIYDESEEPDVPEEPETPSNPETPTEVTLTFDSNGGTAVGPITGIVGENFTAPAAPTKEGYTFDCWEPKLPEVFPEKDTTYTAKWVEKSTYLITYELYGGNNNSKNPDSYKESNSDITLLAPTRTGYNFAGWYTDPNFGNKIDVIPAESTGNINLYANWSPNTYTVTFNANTGEGSMGSQSFTYDAAQNLTANKFTKTGYTFTGWSTTSGSSAVQYNDGQSVSNLTAEPNGNITLYAQWIENGAYSISYVLNNGVNNPQNPNSYKETDNDITLLAPTRTGYNFAGWYTDPDFGTSIGIIQQGSIGDKTLYAKWEAIQYTITYVLNNGTNSTSNPTNYTVETETITFENPTRTGYNFVGWYTEATFATKISEIPTGSIGDKTLYAKWEVIQYKISYELNNGINSDSNPTNYTVETETITFEDPTRTGYNFVGWYTEASFTTKISEIPTGSTGNKQLYAQWTPRTDIAYTVNHYQQNIVDNNYGTTPKDTEKKTGTTGTNTNAVAKTYTGFTVQSFEQQTINADGSTVINIYYNRNIITLTFNDSDGSTIKTISGKYGTTVSAPTPEKEGFTFTGWDKQLPSTFPAENQTFVAQWEENSQPVEIDIEVLTSTLQSGETYTFPAGTTNQQLLDLKSTLIDIDPEAYFTLDLSQTRITELLPNTFFGVDQFEKIIFPTTLKTIDKGAFGRCSDLYTFDLNGNTNFSVDKIGNNNSVLYQGTVLIAAPSMDNDYSIKEGTTEISDYAFSSTSLGSYSLTIPESVTQISPTAFYGFYSLCEFIVDSNNPIYTTIDDISSNMLTSKDKTILYAWPGADSCDIEIPDSITHINDYAFGYIDISSLDLGNVESIGKYAFYYNSYYLETLTIPATVNYIDKNAFLKCDELTTVTFENTEGWYVKESEDSELIHIDVTNATTNATNITTTYADYIWVYQPNNTTGNTSSIQADATVSTYTDLTKAISNATNNTEPYIIAIDGEITVTSGISISSKHIQLIGGSNGGTIILNTSSTSKSIYLQTNAKLVLGGSESSLIIDGSNTSRTYSLITIDTGNKLTLNENCTIQNANTSGAGGAIKLNGGTFIMNAGTIKNNSAKYGAGISISSANSSMTLNGGEIINNSATNTASYGGGGIYVGYSGSFTVSNITFYNNSSNYKGTDIFVDNSDVNLPISDCTFETNSDAIYVNYGNVTVNGETITGSWNPS